MQLALELFAAAFVASVFGSMVGLGGGFILVPILRLFFGLSPAVAAGTSLALVVANSASGAFTYLLQKRVHVKLGLLIAAGGIPGSILGAILVQHISAQAFDWIFCVFLLGVAGDMVFNAQRRVGQRVETRDVSEIKGMSYRVAVFAGFAVGVIGSLLGVGGGVIIVPTLLYFSELPAHAISATSHFGIVLTSPVGLITHWVQGDIRVQDVIPLVCGGLLGGPIGARLSLRLQSKQLLYFVAAALVVAAAALVLRHVLH
jgi:uncharacterized membrane protein YfcA